MRYPRFYPFHVHAHTIGTPPTAFATGFGFRFGLHTHPESKGIYIAEYLFIVLSPCGFIAGLYVLLGRLSQWIGCGQHLLIPARRITLFFVMSDVTTFLIQAAGGSISISNNVQTALAGSHVRPLHTPVFELHTNACMG